VWSAKFRVQIVYLIVYGFVWSVATTQQFIIHLHFGFLTEPHAWEGGWGAAGFRPKLEPKLLGLGLEVMGVVVVWVGIQWHTWGVGVWG
jgi:hypothetical protein